jgi:hypothetical protein
MSREKNQTVHVCDGKVHQQSAVHHIELNGINGYQPNKKFLYIL